MHVGGKMVTGPIRKIGGGYEASITALPRQTVVGGKREHPRAFGTSKTAVAKDAARRIANHEADTRRTAAGQAGDKTVGNSIRSDIGSGTRGETVRKLVSAGRVKATDVKIGKDGKVTVKGQDVGLGIEKVEGGWRMNGGDGYRAKSPRVKTQAAAKSQIARRLNEVVAE